MADLNEDCNDVAAYSNESAKIGTDPKFKMKLVIPNAIFFLVLHIAAMYGFYRAIVYTKIATVVWGIFIIIIGGQGVTMGAHRLFTHKGYKAQPLLRYMLLFAFTLAGQNSLYTWVRDHRQHHKYSDTDADPHNATRGFFFSHIGWLMIKKHPIVLEKGKTIDMSDLKADPLIMLQKKYFIPLFLTVGVAMPVAVPVYFWNEAMTNSIFVAFCTRYVILLNITWCVNSVAHIWGTKPFDKNIVPVESNFVSFISIGEGWHNYHHSFPWDYRAAEFGSKFNWTTFFIDFFNWLGLAYDLKTASPEVIKARILRTGDGTHPVYGNPNNNCSSKLTTNNVTADSSTKPIEK